MRYQYRYAFMGDNVDHEKYLTEEWGQFGWRFTGHTRDTGTGTEYLMMREDDGEDDEEDPCDRMSII